MACQSQQAVGSPNEARRHKGNGDPGRSVKPKGNFDDAPVTRTKAATKNNQYQRMTENPIVRGNETATSTPSTTAVTT